MQITGRKGTETKRMSVHIWNSACSSGLPLSKGCKTSEKGSEEDKEITRCGAASLTNVQVRNFSWELERQLKDVRTCGGLGEQVAHSLVALMP